MFVMTISSVATYLIYYRLLVPHQLEFMNTVVFILVIAALVQMVEIVIKKFPPLISGFRYLSAVDHHQLCGSRRCNFGGPERIFAVALGLFRVGERDRLHSGNRSDGGTAGTHQPKSGCFAAGHARRTDCSDHGSVAFNGVYGLFGNWQLKFSLYCPKLLLSPDLYNDKISKNITSDRSSPADSVHTRICHPPYCDLDPPRRLTLYAKSFILLS